MTPAAPKVSVCLAVFNGANYVAESIESVLGQTFTDFELIVCDNCSTDSTGDIVSAFRDPRLTYVRNPRNLGPVGNFNRSLELARGEYICVWHHDDIMLSENLAHKVRVLDQHPSVGFVHSNVILVGADGLPLGRSWHAAAEDYIGPGLPVFRRYLSHMPIGASIFIGSVLTRRACYERLGPFVLELPDCHDSELWMRLALYYDVAHLATPLVKWRWHPTNTSRLVPTLREASGLRQHYEAVRLVFRNHRHRIPDADPLYRQARAAFARRALDLGWNAFYARHFSLAGTYLRTAVRMAPSALARRSFWSLFARLEAGPTVRRLYRAVVKRAR